MNPVTHFSVGKVTIRYPQRLAEIALTKAEYELVKAMSDRKIMAIKFIKEQYNLGLYEAKQVVDTINPA